MVSGCGTVVKFSSVFVVLCDLLRNRCSQRVEEVLSISIRRLLLSDPFAPRLLTESDVFHSFSASSRRSDENVDRT